MRWFLASLLIALGLVAPVQAASLDQQRIAAIDQAAQDFLAKAAEAHKSGLVPRQTDPGIVVLLDTVFDTRDLSHGPLDYGDFDKLGHWLSQMNAVATVYLSAARKAHDAGLFGAEIGRYADAAAAVLQAMADCQMAKLDAHSGETLSAADQRQLTALRGALTGGFDSLLKLLYAPHVTVGWLEGRLAVMRVTARSLARFLTPAELARLRASIIRLEVVVRDKSLRASLASIAVALATPAAPAAPPVAAATGEIVLQADRGGYSVSGRINDAMTLKFVLDSGAAVVALPSDVVEALTKSGAIQPVDILGHAIYITADGKHHKGTTLMLRQLDVGGHVVTNVRAAVGPASTTPLLGQSFLTKFKSWTLDNQRHMLIITE